MQDASWAQVEETMNLRLSKGHADSWTTLPYSAGAYCIKWTAKDSPNVFFFLCVLQNGNRRKQNSGQQEEWAMYNMVAQTRKDL